VIREAQGAWVTDVEGRRYLDCLSAYSAVNQGHCHPRILATLVEQASRVTLTSRAFRNDQLGFFCEELATLCGMGMVLPMNTGAEAVETAIKAARRWGYRSKGIPTGRPPSLRSTTTFTDAPPPSSASVRSRRIARILVRLRRALCWSRLAISTPYARR
jgi:ornithine--oxo-acid transaminase